MHKRQFETNKIVINDTFIINGNYLFLDLHHVHPEEKSRAAFFTR